jgi:hypothetical protein
MQAGHTLVDWLKLGEFLLRSVLPISDRGREEALLPFAGEPFGVLFIRKGDTCEATYSQFGRIIEDFAGTGHLRLRASTWSRLAMQVACVRSEECLQECAPALGTLRGDQMWSGEVKVKSRRRRCWILIWGI